MAELAVAPQPMTFEDAAALDPDQYPGEIVDGEWIPMTKSTWRHGVVAGNVYLALKLYCRAHPGWSAAVNDPGTKLRRNPDTLRGPDVAVLRAERLPEGKGAAGWVEGSPELVVEAVGDSQTASQAAKALEYLAAGAKIAWVVDPGAELMTVFTPSNQVLIVGAGETLDAGGLLPGFSCQVAEFFE